MFSHKHAISTPKVLWQNYPNNFQNFKPHKNIIPFWWGFPKEIFLKIGGYDEDFIGVAFEDNDIADRLLSILPLVEVDSNVIHLWNEHIGTTTHPERWDYNKKLYESRKGILYRNIEKDWGIL
jgi:predicted glycosyltransferase involved in capsule biosynthesis